MSRAGFSPAVIVLLLGCGRPALPERDGSGGTGGVTGGFLVFPEKPTRKVDLLFMIDNSAGMQNVQQNLTVNFPRFIDTLRALPDGLPDMHVGVISSDMGVGQDGLPGCDAAGGDGGAFHSAVGDGAFGCLATGLDPGQTFVSTTGGSNPQSNFSGDITQVLQCLLPIGSSGCGFERQLASVARALGTDGAPPPAGNVGFLRSDAYLALVLVTDEDDCSARSNSFYDIESSSSLASTLGPPRNFRCNEFGHLCDGAPPKRLTPNGSVDDTVSYQNCVSSESAGLLTPVSELVAGIKALKADPASQIVVASIQGPAAPYQVRWTQPGIQTDGPWPAVAHACTFPAGGSFLFADPGVRMRQFTEAFGGNGLVYSACNDNYGPALNHVVTRLTQPLGPKCIPGSIGAQADCTVIDRLPQSNGSTRDTALPACADNGGVAPCWRVKAGTADACGVGGNHLIIDRGGATPADGLLVLVKCATS